MIRFFLILLSWSLPAFAESPREISLDKKECSKAGVRDYDQSGELVPCAFLFKKTMENLTVAGKDLSAAFLSRSNFKKSRWKDVTLKGVDAWASNFEGASFEDSSLDSAEFTLVDLTAATFTNVKMVNTFLRSSHLKNAVLRNVDLEMGMLEGVDLEGATLDRVNLKGANLAGAKLAGTVFHDVGWDNTTEWPAGFKPVNTDRPANRYAWLLGALLAAILLALALIARRRFAR